ncbi:MAG TPA: ABC transporter permease [Gaiellaceae bacterium]|nr:ABC transporter permease [Gaiellaceae bacterium]
MSVTEAAALELAPEGRRRGETLVRLLRRPSGALAALVVVLIVVGALAAPVLAPHSPTEFDYEHLFAAPSWSHPFGTDELGRDLLSRVLYGARTSLWVAALATVIAMVSGTILGFVAAFRGGWVGEVLMRSVDVTLGMPVILIGLVLVAAFGSSILSLVLILGFLFAPATARLARSAILAELESDYYLAATSVGAPPRRIIFGELLPNTVPVLLARAAIVAAAAIFVEASLSFLGLGVQPPAASWGTLLQTGYASLYSSYWYAVFPGIVIVVTVLALNALGNSFQHALDPSRR